jgi:hypothetical protein
VYIFFTAVGSLIGTPARSFSPSWIRRGEGWSKRGQINTTPFDSPSSSEEGTLREAEKAVKSQQSKVES